MNGTVPRFGKVTRAVHWTTASLMISCIVTAAILYNGFGVAIGHRHLVELVHVYSGLALPVPILLGTLSAAYRLDLRRLNRFTRRDRQWLFSRNRRTGATFVHDWFALAVGLLVIGHITYAIRDREARRGMRTGRVSDSWARAEHEAWADEVVGSQHDDE
ncbi:formate dehydrogenase [Kribbella pittospori]|uniref:Formate dehydrogenase n=1 Tax=Kribbella pittospori TaxID=722689 RepID=A0A4R0JQF9_9ACTN|nr:cytochrome b/b6 domain-containing protein [Kribbella pittospori]TCC49571.1 formate dehydrogenase [Kribbella pittospori]